MADSLVPATEHDRVTLVELVNRVVDRGVVLSGDITISVAEVELLYLGLRLLLCTPDRVLPMAKPPSLPRIGARPAGRETIA